MPWAVLGVRLTIPAEVLAELDAIREAMPVRSSLKVPVILNLYRHKDGSWHVSAEVAGKIFNHTVRNPLTRPQDVA